MKKFTLGQRSKGKHKGSDDVVLADGRTEINGRNAAEREYATAEDSQETRMDG